MPSSRSGITKTDLCPATDVSPSTDTSPASISKPSNHRTDPRIRRSPRRLALRSDTASLMKSKPLQRRVAQKRALSESPISPRPSKRTQQQNAVDRVTAPPEDRRDNTPAVQPTTLSPPSALREGAGGSTTPRNEGLVSRRRTTSNEANNIRIIAAVRPTARAVRPTAPASSEPNGEPPITRNALLELLRASEQRIVKQFVTQQRTVLGRIERVEGEVKALCSSTSAVKNSVADVKVMLLAGGKKNGSKKNASRPANRTKGEKLKDEVVASNPTLPAELDIIFETTDVVCRAAAKTMALQMQKFHRDRDSVSVSSRAMNVFLYSCKSEMGKSVMKEGIGFRHGEFRFKLAKVLLNLTKALPDQLFSVEGVINNPEREERGSPTIARKPSWLTSGLVDVSSLSLARKHHEWFVSDLPKDPTEPRKRMAFFIAKRYFKQAVDMLRRSRENTKGKMYEDGLYCLLDWESLSWFPKVLENPILTFTWPEEDVISASVIPECDVGEPEETHATNVELLHSVISERKEMVVEATYYVTVSKEPTAQGRKQDESKEKRPMRRVINILRLAKSFMCGFCHLSEEDLLRTHPTMLQCIYRFANVFRDIFINHMPSSKRYVRPVKPRGASRATMRRTSHDGGATGSQTNRRLSESGTNGTEGGSSAQRRSTEQVSPNQGSNSEQHSSQRPRPNDDSVRSGATKETGRVDVPPVKLATLFPADSEMDRLLENYTDIFIDTYDRINVPETSEGEMEMTGAISDHIQSDAGAGDEESDSGD